MERCTSGPYVVKMFDVFDDGSVREQPTEVTELVMIAAPTPTQTGLSACNYLEAFHHSFVWKQDSSMGWEACHIRL